MVHYFVTYLRSQTKREGKETRREEKGKGWAGRAEEIVLRKQMWMIYLESTSRHLLTTYETEIYSLFLMLLAEVGIHISWSRKLVFRNQFLRKKAGDDTIISITPPSTHFHLKVSKEPAEMRPQCKECSISPPSISQCRVAESSGLFHYQLQAWVFFHSSHLLLESRHKMPRK